MKLISTILVVVLLFSSFDSALSLCGYCVPRGEVCVFDQCADNLKCVDIGGASVCLPVVEAGQDCNTTDGLYDPCETGFDCNVKCVPQYGAAISNLNDGCIDDTYCRSGTTCVTGICKSTTAATTFCTAATCRWDEFCGFTGTCTPLKGVNEDCLSVDTVNGPISNCRSSLSCLNTKCIEQFSVAIDGICTDTEQCKTGLICKNGNCKEPKHVLILGAYGAAWGAPCDQVLSQLSYAGCRCHYGLKNYYYLKEVSQTFNFACPQKRKDFAKCMLDKGCNSVNLNAMSCLRTNCYHFYTAMDDCRTDPSLIATRCSGNAVMAALFLLVLMLFV
jgi:hypothetical protein